MAEDITTRVRRMVALNLGRTSAECTDETTLEALGCDSLDHISIMIDAETEFELGTGITDEAAEKIRTVGDLVSYVRTHHSPGTVRR